MEVTGGRGIKVDRKATGTLLTAEIPRPESGAKCRLLRLKSIFPDYLQCRPWGGTDDIADDGMESIYVLRDPELQRTRFDGKTIAYSSDGDAFSASFAYSSNTKRVKTVSGAAETQIILPLYKVDFTIIKAMLAEESIPAFTPAGGSSTFQVSHVEFTQRAWAKI